MRTLYYILILTFSNFLVLDMDRRFVVVHSIRYWPLSVNAHWYERCRTVWMLLIIERPPVWAKHHLKWQNGIGIYLYIRISYYRSIYIRSGLIECKKWWAFVWVMRSVFPMPWLLHMDSMSDMNIRMLIVSHVTNEQIVEAQERHRKMNKIWKKYAANME